MIIQKFPSGPLETNAILFGCSSTKKAAVIDPAYGSTDDILTVVAEKGLQLEMILLTHSHWDHIADIYSLQEKTGVPVFVHSLDVGNLEHPGSDGIPMVFPIQGVKPDGFLEEGQSIQVGNLQIDVIHTPGHSPGSVCFYIAAENVLFSGDTLFQGTIGSLQLPTSEPEKMWVSLKKLALLPEATEVIPGHGGDTTLEEESWLDRAEQIFKD